MTILTGDCRLLMPAHAPCDMILADPPSGDMSLIRDCRVEGWPALALALARQALAPSGSLWLSGSLRSFIGAAQEFASAGLGIVQEVIRETQNGSAVHADRFSQVHQLAAPFIRDDAAWGGIFNDVPKTQEATARTVRRKRLPPLTGHIEAGHYVSEQGAPRLMRSVIDARNCHGRAIHPTEKLVGLREILIRTSCPPGGLAGDWFAGFGAAGEACRAAGRRYLGCEIDTGIAAGANDCIAATLPLGGAPVASHPLPGDQT